MKKIKLCGVSLCTLLAATGANAAGYTCEELIEYTSCNTGYALVSGDCIRTCDAGYFLSGTDCEICPIGSYSLAGSSECTSCPETALKDKNGNTVVATTASAGATGASFCFIGQNVEFQDTTGIWHFKSSCSYQGLTPGTSSGGGTVVMTEQQACEADEYAVWEDGECQCDSADVEWLYDAASGIGYCFFAEHDGMPHSDCLYQGGSWDFENRTCNCPYGLEFEYNPASGDFYYCDAGYVDEEECYEHGGHYYNDFNGTCACENGEGWQKDSDGNLYCE